MNYYVYILRCSDNTLYTGITTDIQRRINEHNTSSKGAKYTHSRRPVSLLYFEELSDKSSALKRELEIKRMKKEKKELLLKEKPNQEAGFSL